MKSNSKHAIVTWFFLVIISAALGACQVFEESPTRIQAMIEASEDLNPDHGGQASPIVVRMYQLSSPTAFNNASYFALQDNDVAELGEALKGMEEIELRPGQKLELARELNPGTNFVGFMAGYRDIDNASWRAIAEVPTGAKTEVTIEFRRLDVQIVEID